MPLIEDSVYSAVHYGATDPYAAKAYDHKGNVILCGSFSKTLAPGFRVGFIAPGRHYEAVRKLKFVTSIGVPELLQAAVAEFLSSGGYHRYLRRLRRFAADQVMRHSEAVMRHFPRGTRMSRPSGGYVLWVEMPEGVDSIEMQQQAMRHGIGISPGAIYSASMRYRNCLRLNCALPWTRETEAAIETLGEIAKKLSSRVREPTGIY